MTSSESDSAHADIGIVSALPIELGQFMDRCERVKHYKGEDLTFKGGRYDGIRVVVIVDQHGQKKKLNLSLESDVENGLHVGRLLTADEMVRTVEQKRQLHEDCEAIAVDMESLAVAQVAAETKTGFMAVRVISDDMSADLPSEVLSIIGDTGAVRVGAALTSIFKRPESVKDMLHLRTNAQAAAKSLATFLDGVVHQLHAAG